MYNREYCNKYKLLFSPDIESGKIEKTHDLDNTSGETLISDGATLTCKEQLGYHTYSQSSNINPYNGATPLITMSLPSDRNVFLFGLLPLALTTDLDIKYFSGYEKLKCPIDGAPCTLKPVEWISYYDGIEVNGGYPLLMGSRLKCQKAVDHGKDLLQLVFMSNGQEELGDIRAMMWWSERAPYYGVDPNTNNIFIKGYIKAMDALSAYNGVKKVISLAQGLGTATASSGAIGTITYTSVKLVYAVDGGISSINKLITGKNYSIVREIVQTKLAKEAYLKEYEKEHPIKANICRASETPTDLMPPLSWLLKPAQEAVFCGSYSSTVGTGKSYSDIYNDHKHETDEILIYYDTAKLVIDTVEGGKSYSKFLESGDPSDFAKAKKIIDLANSNTRNTNRILIDTSEEYYEYNKLIKENKIIIKDGE